MGLLNAIGGLFQSPEDRVAGKTNMLQNFGKDLGDSTDMNRTPASILEWQQFNGLTPEQQAKYLLMKRAQPLLNQGDQYSVYNPVNQQVSSIAPINPKVAETPQFKADQQEAVKNVDLVVNPKIVGAETDAKLKKELEYGPKIDSSKKEAEQKTANKISAEQTLPVIDKLTEYNQKSFDSPYMGNLGKVGRIIPNQGIQEKSTNLDLLVQARKELAAPLAKQLGVNPTDRDFQASLDRIFDINSDKKSRQAQIDALAERIKMKNSGGEAPSGASPGKLIGTSGGKKIFQLPDGSHVMEQ